MGDLDPRCVLQLRCEIGEHQPAAVVGLLLAGLLRGAEIPAAGDGQDADDDERDEGAGLHARALARRRLRSDAEDDRQDRQQGRHQHDVEHAQPGLQPRDVAVQIELHGAQLLARIDDVLARGVDRGALLRRDHRLCVGLFAAAWPLAQRAELLFGVVEVLLQRLLGLAELRLRLALHLVHQHERMVGVAARAQSDQRVAAGERADQVGDERPVVAERHRRLLAEEVADMRTQNRSARMSLSATTTRFAGPSVCAL